MFLSQFYLPPEAAYNCIAELGEMGEEEAQFGCRVLRTIAQQFSKTQKGS